MWDRQGREFQGLVAQSKVNDNTQGSKVEKELDEIVAVCSKADAELIAIEQATMVKGNLSDDDIATVAKLCDALKKNGDAGKEKQIGLKAWFRL